MELTTRDSQGLACISHHCLSIKGSSNVAGRWYVLLIWLKSAVRTAKGVKYRNERFSDLTDFAGYTWMTAMAAYLKSSNLRQRPLVFRIQEKGGWQDTWYAWCTSGWSSKVITLTRTSTYTLIPCENESCFYQHLSMCFACIKKILKISSWPMKSLTVLVHCGNCVEYLFTSSYTCLKIIKPGIVCCLVTFLIDL